MSYRHDVFISYKREELWTPWTRDHFKRLLKPYLQQELGREPEIFVDEHLHVGADWVDGLADELAASRILVPIFSGDYFGSDWCLHELDLMFGRALAMNPKDPPHLIIPVIAHDGDLIPDLLQRIKPVDVKEYRIACMIEATPLYQQFSVTMKGLAPAICNAVNAAPPYNDTWREIARKRFNEIFEAQKKGAVLDPKSFVAKRPSPPLIPPRLKVVI